MSKLLIILSRNWAVKIGNPLVAKIKEDLPDLEVAGLVHKYNTYDYLEKQKDVKYKHLWLIDDLWDQVYDPEVNPLISAKEIEEDLGINSIWELINTVRTLIYDVRGCPIFDYGKTVSDADMLKLAKIFYLHIREVWGTYKPDIVFTHDFITMYHLMLYHYSKKRGVYMFTVVDSKVSGYCIEKDNPLNIVDGEIKNLYEQNKKNYKKSKNYNNALEYINKNREELYIPDYTNFKAIEELDRAVKIRILRSPLSFAKAIVMNIIRKEDKRHRKHFKNIDYIPPMTLLRNIFREYICFSYFKKIKFYIPKEKDKYVYFPLQYEPEAHTMVQALYFTNQIELIRAVAKSLPGDYTLYVKEHPAMYGRRKRGYYKQILGIPNVKLISYEYTFDYLIRKCSAVVTATGTSSFEAAVLQKPSIMFGTDFHTILPHIRRVTDFSRLSKVFKEILDEDFSAPKHEDALISYITTVMDRGVKLNYFKLMENLDELDIFRDYMVKIIKQKI
jgi:hypothetical protein